MTETEAAILSEKLSSMDRRMERIEHAIVGNGKDGLEVRTTRLEAGVGLIKWAVGTMAGGGGIGAIIAFVKYL